MLVEFLRKNRGAVLEKWTESVFLTYPEDGASFLGKEKDQFKNPVGATIAAELAAAFDELIGGQDQARLAACAEEIVRIRAVQNFRPARAVGFFFLLKTAIRDAALAEVKKAKAIDELLDLESRIDTLSLITFEKYLLCRERVYEIKANEIRARSIRALNRLGAGDGGPGEKDDAGEGPDRG